MKLHFQLYGQGHIRKKNVFLIRLLEKPIHFESIPSAQEVHYVHVFLAAILVLIVV